MGSVGRVEQTIQPQLNTPVWGAPQTGYQEMVQLEQHPKDAALLASIFRAIHTIKGTCGFLARNLEKNLAPELGLDWQLKDNVRRMVDFQKLDLRF
jgi:hypothetical protein